MKIRYLMIISIVIVAVVSTTLYSFNAYAEWGLAHPEKNNTRDIWIGSWQNPFYIINFHGECYIAGLGVDWGKEKVAYFVDSISLQSCTRDDFTRIQMYNIAPDEPFKDSGICTFEFENAKVISNQQEYGGVQGKFDTKLTMRTEMSVPLKCFIKVLEDKCEWDYGTHEEGTEYCDVPSELDKEHFWGLARHFSEVVG